MKKRVGIIGFDDVGKTHFNELRRSDRFETVGIYDKRRLEDCCRVKFYYDINELFSDSKPEILVISDGIKYYDIFLKCIKICKNILFCAPVAKGVTTIQEMKYGSKTDNATVAIGFFTRFNPVIVSLKKAISKEQKIFSVNIIRGLEGEENLSFEVSQNVDLLRYLCASDIVQSNKFENYKSDKKSLVSASYLIKTRNLTLASIQVSQNYPIDRFIIEIACDSGVYLGDLINLKLYKYTSSGQQNLKVDSDITALRLAYDEFYELCDTNKFGSLATLDDALKVYEVCG